MEAELSLFSKVMAIDAGFEVLLMVEEVMKKTVEEVKN